MPPATNGRRAPSRFDWPARRYPTLRTRPFPHLHPARDDGSSLGGQRSNKERWEERRPRRRRDGATGTEMDWAPPAAQPRPSSSPSHCLLARLTCGRTKKQISAIVMSRCEPGSKHTGRPFAPSRSRGAGDHGPPEPAISDRGAGGRSMSAVMLQPSTKRRRCHAHR